MRAWRAALRASPAAPSASPAAAPAFLLFAVLVPLACARAAARCSRRRGAFLPVLAASAAVAALAARHAPFGPEARWATLFAAGAAVRLAYRRDAKALALEGLLVAAVALPELSGANASLLGLLALEAPLLYGALVLVLLMALSPTDDNALPAVKS